MPVPAVRWAEQLQRVSGFVLEEFQGITAAFRGLWEVEHKDDGTHANLTCDTLTINGNRQHAQTVFQPTVASVDNTTTKTAFCTFSVTGGTMKHGDIILVDVIAVTKNNKGSSGTFTLECAWGDVTGALVAITTDDVATEGAGRWIFQLGRHQNDLWFAIPSAYSAQASNFAQALAVILTAPNFAQTRVVELRMTLSAANANFYFRPQIARARRISTV